MKSIFDRLEDLKIPYGVGVAKRTTILDGVDRYSKDYFVFIDKMHVGKVQGWSFTQEDKVPKVLVREFVEGDLEQFNPIKDRFKMIKKKDGIIYEHLKYPFK